MISGRSTLNVRAGRINSIHYEVLDSMLPDDQSKKEGCSHSPLWNQHHGIYIDRDREKKETSKIQMRSEMPRDESVMSASRRYGWWV